MRGEVQSGAREVQSFIYGQAFADGLRATIAILLPALSGLFFGFFETGLTISLGAMCVSLTDAPGPLVHKRNGMLGCALLIFLTALLTGYARLHVLSMGALIAVATFLFSMLTVYGNRASAVGNAAILIMILTMDKPVAPSQVPLQAAFILAGGLFYTSISLLLYTLRPYRYAERALGECIREIAQYLSIKADFYNPATDLHTDYRRLVAQQVLVNEKQDAVREFFFKTRQIVEESTEQGRRLVFTFVVTVDLFEDITAAYYDYALLRRQFGNTGALQLINQSLKKIVSELQAIGLAVQSQTSFQPSFDYDEEIRQLKARIDSLPLPEEGQRLVLKKLVVNIRRLLTDTRSILTYFEKGLRPKKSALDHAHFVTHQPLSLDLLIDNLTLQSSVFRHALRMVIACLIGYALIRVIGYGEYSYWILLTIAFIIKPAFSLTKQRNIERITGTVIGGAIGVLVLLFIPKEEVRFALMVVFMIGAYSFIRTHYLSMVIFITPYVLILFSFLGAGFRDVAQERLLDTLIGCGIALSVSYLLFPRWESEQLRELMLGIVRANKAYLDKALQALEGKKVSLLEYKLARKEVYLQSANLAAAFQRMLSEPKSKQRPPSQVHQFVVLNHILFSNVATLVTSLLQGEPRAFAPELVHLARRAGSRLAGSQQQPDSSTLAEEKREAPEKAEGIKGDEALMKEQLYFIYTVSDDISKLAAELAGPAATGQPAHSPPVPAR
jgi:uncharacterized membrane protein (TIGR01666 family)